ncbi:MULTISPECIES: flavin-containing monooxygenase [unclassified Rathayibacter]|uniref:flavin-containing monooxygenase n=1 Tax=unclassified Rathayibacter TaxID=2609250 RepID=UPI00188CA4A0|nr:MULTISPECIES: NAD(P)/FAD-dependent oxidoreductase [unclassified Rathayibacter]MBF4463161.1 NAD(P)/FAD-dependent oxidoreductase [Rathayibacter sp. VKM Ac-2879]MBF4504602.1 NAD(P)/FAD-dependent oxidoreductase [Rathayibacter sp. VKM Ac-2878]
MDATPHIRVAIIGAGFSGLGAAIRLAQEDQDDFLVFERAEEVGGTWRDNSYPGAACDVMSLLYSYSFAPYSGWERTFGTRDEILAYLIRTTDRSGIRDRIRFGHRLEEAQWDQEAGHWLVRTSRGDWTADVLVLGTGYLSEPSLPSLPGLDGFAGTAVHSSQWDPSIDLAGKSVAVVGTGASAIQIVPSIQPQVAELTVYQRTPAWVAPKPDKKISALQRWLRTSVPGYQRFRRLFNKYGREIVVALLSKPELMRKTLQGNALAHLHASVPAGPLRDALTPDYVAGCKRVLFSNDYYPALTSGNTELVSSAVSRIEGSLVIAGEDERDIDVLIFATGFSAVDRPVAHLIRDTQGRTLASHWAGGASAYLGSTVAGFPNLVLLMGPNTALGHSSQTVMIEAQLAYLVSALAVLRARGARSFEVRRDVQDRHDAMIRRRFDGTVWQDGGCASWYADASGRNPSIWPSTTTRFERLTRTFSPSDYLLTSVSARALTPSQKADR